MKVSIIIPITKPKTAKRCIEAVKANAGVEPNQYEIVTETDTKRIGCPKMIRKLTERSKYDCVMFLGDDTYPYPNFLKYAIEAMESLPDGWGLVGLNDLVHDGNQLATHWLAHKKLLPHIGGEFFHTGYKHGYCDQELLLRCQRLNRYVWCRDAMLFHDHPESTGKKAREGQADYDRIKSWYKQDSELFQKRILRF